MKLTKEMVESLRDGTSGSLPIAMPMSKDICEDNLAMRKMLEWLQWRGGASYAICPSCGALPEGEHHDDCKLKELLGVTDD